MLSALLASALMTQGPTLHQDPLATGMDHRAGLLYQKSSISEHGGCTSIWQLKTVGKPVITVELAPLAQRALIDGGQPLPARVELAGEWNGEVLQAKRLYSIKAGGLGVPDEVLKQIPTLNTPVPDPSLPEAMAYGVENRKYLVLLLRFKDTAGNDPHPKSWYTKLMRDTFPGLGATYRENSYGKLTVVGNQIIGWLDLPGNMADYESGGYDVQKLINGAIPLIDKKVDFSTIWGVNVFPNRDDNSGFSYATGATMNTDEGVFSRPVTMCNPWADQFVVVHEMGHNFDFDHSSTGDGVYNSNWSPMGNGGRYWPNVYQDLGTIAVEHNAYHKIHAGWIDEEHIANVLPGQTKTLRIERIGNPKDTNAVRTAQVFIPGLGSRYYTIESRKYAGYDRPGAIAGECIALHLIDGYKAWNPGASRFIDIDGNGDTSDEGAMWRVGETFTGEGGVTISVLSEDASGFTVKVTDPSSVYRPGEVVNTNDDGPGSLREQLWFASAVPGTKVKFNIPTSDPNYQNGVFTFRPQSALPYLNGHDITIDGATQTKKTGNTNAAGPEIFIDGSQAGAYADALVVQGSRTAVQNVAAGGFDSNGIWMQYGHDNKVVNCQFGLAPNGKDANPNGFHDIGLYYGAANNQVSNNVVCNASAGVAVYGTGSNGNTISNNSVGVDATATGAPGNFGQGILLYAGAASNRVQSNVICSNPQGIYLQDGSTTGNQIVKNLIGLLKDGTTVRGNGIGIYGFTAAGNAIGGSAIGLANTIVGSDAEGILLEQSVGNAIQFNYIGRTAFSSVGTGNHSHGVRLSNSAGGAISGNVVASNWGSGVQIENSSDVAIGDGSATKANTILSNQGVGVGVTGSSQRVTIRGNRISANGQIGIDLNTDGVSGNDTDDSDAGPNGLTNFPTVTVEPDGPELKLTLKLFAAPNRVYVLDVYGLAAADPLGYGEGDVYLGSKTVTTDASGIAGILFHVPPTVQLRSLSATATGTEGTSEFSAVYTGKPIPVFTLDPTSGVRGQAVTLSSTAVDRLTGAPMAGRSVSFYVKNALVGTATTNASGVATLNYTVAADAPATLKVKAVLAGTFSSETNTDSITMSVSG